MSELHICTIGQQFSFRPDGAPLDARSPVFSALRYGEAPDAVLVTYGIQGEGYFRDFAAHIGEVMKGCKAIMGYVFPRHVAIYARVGRRHNIDFRELFRGFPYGPKAGEFSWVVGERRV